MSFVLPVLKGGLGNQMFQFAAALVYAKETGKQILLPEEEYNYHRKTEPYGNTLFRAVKMRLPYPVDQGRMALLQENGFVKYPEEPGYDEWEVFYTSQNIILNGYFQNYTNISRHRKYIQSFFLDALNMVAAEGTPSVGIHVRRGDYLRFSDIHFLQGGEYYTKALGHFNKDSSFKVFSDDIEWCKQQPYFAGLNSVEFIDETDEIKCLKIMIQCKGGFICANSTYSWWAAFLGPYISGNPVIVPSNWIKDGVKNLFPSEWIVI